MRDNFERLAETLLGQPSGRNGHEWRWGTRGSLAVVVRGPKRGVWRDHEADQGGGPLDLMMHTQGCSLADAIAWSCSWIGMSPAQLAAMRVAPRPGRATRDAEEAARQAGKLATAARLWAESRPLGGTPAAAYLSGPRAIPVPAAWPDALRFHPGRPGPCSLIAAVTWPDGTLRAVHRVFLTQAGAKAGVIPEKRSDGVLAGAVVRLAPPGPPGQPLMLGEGVETSISLLAATWAATWATLGRVPGADELPHDRPVVFARDDDAVGSGADLKLWNALVEWRAAGIDLRVATPWAKPRGDRTDFNDVIRQGGPRAVLARIEAA